MSVTKRKKMKCVISSGGYYIVYELMFVIERININMINNKTGM